MKIISSVFLLVISTLVCASNAHSAVSRKHTKVVHSARYAKKATVSASTKHKKLRAQAQNHSHNANKAVAASEGVSVGRLTGLHNTTDELDLKSSVALVVDQDTNEVLLSKNDSAVLPIASITKLMTAVIISESNLPMDETITISSEDVANATFSRLKAGASMTRLEMLHLALMSSENRAAYALGRTYPGGINEFVNLMNAKARFLGMKDTHYVEPTGLSSNNQSTAQDLAKLVAYASNNELIREFSTSHGYQISTGRGMMNYVNTNRLTSNPNWSIDVQKTGYISAAGRCLVMQAQVAGRKLVMVFLDSMGKYSRIGDAERVKAWVESLSRLNPRIYK